MQEYVLKNRDHAILTFSFDENNGLVTSANQFLDMAYAPYSFQHFEKTVDALNEWFSRRYGFNTKLNVRHYSYQDELKLKQSIVKANGLSLSDQYWFHSVDKDLDWKDVNFFTNDFEYKKYISLSFTQNRNEYTKADMIYSPNSTTGGQLEKAWIIDEKTGERCLLKSANTFFLTEPINEVIAYEFANILGVHATKYEPLIVSDLKRPVLASKCATFITPDTELISAFDIIMRHEKDTLESTIRNYIQFLEDHGVPDASRKIQKQLLLDTMLDNTDRHLNNFGVIRDVESLQIIDVAPLFDNGRILGTTYPYLPQRYTSSEFNILEFNYDATREQLLDLIDERIELNHSDYEKLYDLPDHYLDLLRKYSDYTSLRDDDKIHICTVLKESIAWCEDKLKQKHCFIDQ